MKRIIAIMAVLLPVLCFGARKEIRTVVFSTHLHCENCVKKVVENISFVKGVKDLDVSLENQQIKIVYDAARTDVQKLSSEIRKLGYECEESTARTCESCKKKADEGACSGCKQ